MNWRCFSLNHRWLMIMTTKDEHLTWGKFSRAHASARPLKKYCMLWRLFLVLNRRAPTRVCYAKLTNGANATSATEKNNILLFRNVNVKMRQSKSSVYSCIHLQSVYSCIHLQSVWPQGAWCTLVSKWDLNQIAIHPPPAKLSIKFNISNVKSSILNHIILVQW